MKLKKWLKLVDPIVDVVIWTPDDEEEPAFEGAMFDIPWYLVEREIGRSDITDSDEPIYISYYTNEHKVTLPRIVINLL